LHQNLLQQLVNINHSLTLRHFVR